MFWRKVKDSATNLSQPKLTAVSDGTPWASITVCGCQMFCIAVQFTLFFSSLYPYLKQLDPSATENFYGSIVAVYSFGQIISGPIVGWWSTKTKSIVTSCYICLTLTLFGNLVYVSAALVPSAAKWIILTGRFFVGMGGLSLYQGFSSTASRIEDRGKALAMTTGGLALGLCIGPAIQLVFTPFGYPGFPLFGHLTLNMYTAPALSCCLVNLLGLGILRFVFVEQYAGLANPTANSKEEKTVAVPKYDRLAVVLCHLGRFTQLFAFTNLETLGAPFMMSVFAVTRAAAVQYLAISHSAIGAIGLIFYIGHFAIKVEKIVDFRKVFIVGLFGFIVFHIVTFSWPFLPGKLHTYTAEDYEMYLNGTITDEPVGCPIDEMSWCDTTAPTNLWVFMGMMVFVMGACWPNINVTLSTILSKVLGPRRQAHQQSIFQMSASAARLIGPIAISNIYTSFGPEWAWLLEIIVVSITVLLWIIFYRRLVPLQMDDPNNNSDNV